MPKCWADRAIMFCVIGLVAWGVIGLPALRSFWPAYQPAHAQTAEPAADGTKTEQPWLTKDASGFFTFLLVVVGGFQVRLFVWQLWLIRKSLDDAKTVADAAKKSADAAKELADATTAQGKIAQDTLATMQDTARREMRAYVVANYMTCIHQDNKTGYRFEPRVAMVNTGRTPAYNTTYRAKADVLPSPLPNDFDFALPDVPVTSTSTLGTAQNFIMSAAVDRMYSDDEIEEIKQAVSKRIYIWGVITYDDAFGESRYTNFAMSIVYMADRTANVSHSSHRHNDAN